METLLLYILTFNCARNLIDTDLVAAHLFDALPLSSSTSPSAPHLLVLSLQEIAPIAPAFLGGHHLTPYFDAFTNAVTRAAAARFPGTQQQQHQHQHQHYVRLATDHVGMTALMVFARADVAPRLGAVQTARVGLGLQQMGNKGAVGVRVRYTPVEGEGEGKPVEMTFVGAHLAPAEGAFERRNQDWRGIVERLVFEGVMRRPGREAREGEGGEVGGGEADGDGEESERAALLGSDSTDTSVEVMAVDTDGGETAVGAGADADTDTDTDTDPPRREQGIFTPTGYLFLAGDLNYRTSNTLPLPRDSTRFPRLDADADDPLHWTQLLPRDQLTRERNQGRCFHGLSEAPVTFPPTYKYRIGARDSRDWAWTRARWPSWCDRVLYLEDQPGLAVTVHGYDALPLFPTSDHRAVALAADVSVPGQQERSKLEPKSKSKSRSLSHLDADASEGEGDSNGADGQAARAPFPIDRDWKRQRDEARRKELVVGGLAYLVLTWEGQRLLLAMVVGSLGVWFVLRSLFGR